MKRKTKKIDITILPNDLSSGLIDEMWALYKNYYHNTKEEFLYKMSKNNYYSFYTNNAKIVGFTGLRINQMNVNAKKVFLMYFGETVIERPFRGKSLIPLTGFKLCVKFAKQILSSRSFFWAETLTYKAYLLFAKTLDTYFPSRKEKTPKEIKELMNQIGKIYYNSSYIEESGVVKKATKLVKDPSSEINVKTLSDPDVSFFASPVLPLFCL